jgi:hypothetical protein
MGGWDDPGVEGQPRQNETLSQKMNNDCGQKPIEYVEISEFKMGLTYKSH